MLAVQFHNKPSLYSAGHPRGWRLYLENCPRRKSTLPSGHVLITANTKNITPLFISDLLNS